MDFQNLDRIKAFDELKGLKPASIKELLSPERIASSWVEAGASLRYNWAAMPIDEEHLRVLQALSDEAQLIDKYRALLDGAVMNTGEGRQVLHHLARGQVGKPVIIDGEDKRAFYEQELSEIKEFAQDVRSGELVGSTGKPFTTVVQIGIGGSDLGPRALCLALKGWAAFKKIPTLDARFISNVDPDDAAQVLSEIDLEHTLFILVSKSGTTEETLTNREFVSQALQAKGLRPIEHIVVVTGKDSPLTDRYNTLDSSLFGNGVLTPFFIDNYIGGRYSATSAVGGLIISLAFGYETFQMILSGAHQADVQALNPSIGENAALLDALIGVYLRNVLCLPSTAILPYSQALSRFSAHLQQLDMESNGKSVNRDGEAIGYPTGPVIFGEPGTNGQHSFYQLLHQGTDIVPLQFIGFRHCQSDQDVTVQGSTSQQKLNANLVAQIVAFARGKENANANKRFGGERPSSLLFANRLTPELLGALLAHYENKVMFQGFLWNVNSFDQEGVQLGKVLATNVLKGSKEDPVLKSWAKIFGL